MKKQQYVLKFLGKRSGNLGTLADYFGEKGISPEKAKAFDNLMQEGGEKLKERFETNPYDFSLRQRLEKFMIASVQLLGAVWFEFPEEICELVENIELFEAQNDVVRRFLDGDNGLN